MYRPLSGMLCVDGDIKGHGSSKIYTSIRKWDDLGYLFPLLPAHWSLKALRPCAHSQMMSLSFPKMWQGSLGQSVVVRNKLFQCWNPPRSVTIPFRIGAIHTQCFGVASSSPTWEAQGCRAAWSMLPSPAAVFRQEHRNFSSCVSVSYLGKISSVISLYHRASCCNKREEKSNRCDRCDLQRTEQKGAGEYNSFHPFSWIKGNNLLRHL